ncbi:hypothetical protein Nepgr_007986 [Nepenthes gracilis]|uniref:Uncharacterized protein n=1 Tax=Nepenthes gracilis TaxID=150966 RepID=A0AAD3S895_NEPGR|nr:hypothetical protein Nepgr_007986 [Nepenthes gracilis]
MVLRLVESSYVIVVDGFAGGGYWDCLAVELCCRPAVPVVRWLAVAGLAFGDLADVACVLQVLPFLVKVLLTWTRLRTMNMLLDPLPFGADVAPPRMGVEMDESEISFLLEASSCAVRKSGRLQSNMLWELPLIEVNEPPVYYLNLEAAAGTAAIFFSWSIVDVGTLFVEK